MLKVDKSRSKKLETEPSGTATLPYTANEYRAVAKEVKIIETSKKTRKEVWREASAITGIGDHWGIPLLFGVSTDRAPFYLVLQFHALRSESVTLFKAASEKVIQHLAMCANILKQICEILMFIHERARDEKTDLPNVKGEVKRAIKATFAHLCTTLTRNKCLPLLAVKGESSGDKGRRGFLHNEQ